MGAPQEDDTEVGGVTGRLGEVLSRHNTGSTVVRGEYLGVVEANGSEAGGSYLGFLRQVKKFKVKSLRGGLWRKLAA